MTQMGARREDLNSGKAAGLTQSDPNIQLSSVTAHLPAAGPGGWVRRSYRRQSPRICERVLLASSRRSTLNIAYHTSTRIPEESRS
jgi:hypothetical protein